MRRKGKRNQQLIYIDTGIECHLSTRQQKSNGLVIKEKWWNLSLRDKVTGILWGFLNVHLKYLIISLSEDADVIF